MRTHSNYDSKKELREVNNNDSLTIPAQSMTVRELMKKHNAGITPNIARVPIWDQHPSFDSWDVTLHGFDLADATLMISQMEERQIEIKAERDRVKRAESQRLNERLKELKKYEAKLQAAEENKQNVQNSNQVEEPEH